MLRKYASVVVEDKLLELPAFWAPALNFIQYNLFSAAQFNVCFGIQACKFSSVPAASSGV